MQSRKFLSLLLVIPLLISGCDRMFYEDTEPDTKDVTLHNAADFPLTEDEIREAQELADDIEVAGLPGFDEIEDIPAIDSVVDDLPTRIGDAPLQELDFTDCKSCEILAARIQRNDKEMDQILGVIKTTALKDYELSEVEQDDKRALKALQDALEERAQSLKNALDKKYLEYRQTKATASKEWSEGFLEKIKDRLSDEELKTNQELYEKYLSAQEQHQLSLESDSTVGMSPKGNLDQDPQSVQYQQRIRSLSEMHRALEEENRALKKQLHTCLITCRKIPFKPYDPEIARSGIEFDSFLKIGNKYMPIDYTSATACAKSVASLDKELEPLKKQLELDIESTKKDKEFLEGLLNTKKKEYFEARAQKEMSELGLAPAPVNLDELEAQYLELKRALFIQDESMVERMEEKLREIKSNLNKLRLNLLSCGLAYGLSGEEINDLLFPKGEEKGQSSTGQEPAETQEKEVVKETKAASEKELDSDGIPKDFDESTLPGLDDDDEELDGADLPGQKEVLKNSSTGCESGFVPVEGDLPTSTVSISNPDGSPWYDDVLDVSVAGDGISFTTRLYGTSTGKVTSEGKVYASTPEGAARTQVFDGSLTFCNGHWNFAGQYFVIDVAGNQQNGLFSSSLPPVGGEALPESEWPNYFIRIE